MRVEVEVDERVDLVADLQDDVTTVAAIASIGATQGDEFLAANGRAPMAAIASADMQHNAVNKLRHEFQSFRDPARVSRIKRCRSYI